MKRFIFLLPVVLLAGCANKQIIQNSHVSGVKTSATVPIPFVSGAYFLAVSLAAGDIKDNVIVQDTVTNGSVGSAPVSIVQNTYSTAGVSGTATTNGAAGITTLQHDQNVISTSGTVGTTNGSVSVINK